MILDKASLRKLVVFLRDDRMEVIQSWNVYRATSSIKTLI